MKRLLHIISSPKGEHSITRKLGNAIVAKIQEKYKDSELTDYDLAKIKIPNLEKIHIDSFFIPAENRSPDQQNAVKHSEQAIAELQRADIIVIDAPMYNFTITSTLKTFLDHIARAGITFRYTGNGLLPEGLLKNKQAYIATSSGGIYSEGELKQYDFVEPYLRFFLTLIGIDVVNVFRAEGQAIVGQETALQKGIASIAID